MFRRLINWLKEVISRMFTKGQMKRITGRDVALSNIMLGRMDLWERMLKGEADWVDKYGSGVKSLKLESAICREFANVALSEMETSIEKIDVINDIYQRAVKAMNADFQDALAMGCFAIKPIGSSGKYEFIPANRIIPLEYDDEKKLRACAFVQIKMESDEVYYYRIEQHELVNTGEVTSLHIHNSAYKGSADNIGSEVPLTDINEWSDLIPDVTYPIDRMDFGYYRNPLPNRIDGSSTPVSIFEEAVDQIRDADIQLGRIDWEYDSGERMIFADYSAVMKKNDGKSFKAPNGKNRLIVGTDLENQWEEHGPALRDQNYINGLNEYKRQIEFNVGLAYGDLSKNEQIEKTAQEIRSSKDRKYNMVNAIQQNLKTCLEDFAYALAFYYAVYSDDIGFECNFHDSIKTDEETERQQDRMDMQLGIMSKLEYRQKWYGEDQDTAAANLAQVTTELQAQAAQDDGIK